MVIIQASSVTNFIYPLSSSRIWRALDTAIQRQELLHDLRRLSSYLSLYFLAREIGWINRPTH